MRFDKSQLPHYMVLAFSENRFDFVCLCADGKWRVSDDATLFVTKKAAEEALKQAGPRDFWPIIEILTVDEWLTKYRPLWKRP